MTCEEAIRMMERVPLFATAVAVIAFAAGVLLEWLTRPRVK